MSRREMARRLWPDSESAIEQHYGLGLIAGRPGPWEWFGHQGAFQGYITMTAMLPRQGLTASALTNAVDGPAQLWLGGVGHILETMATGGAPAEKTRSWAGRWWSLWGAVDLVPVGDGLRTAVPSLLRPFEDGMTIAVTGEDSARVARGSGFRNVGESVRLLRAGDGTPADLWFGGVQLLPEASFAREITARYDSR